MRSCCSALSSGAAAAATELALREELSRKDDTLADAAAEIRQLQQQLKQPLPTASARSPATVLEGQERLLELQAREAKLKTLLKKLQEAKASLEQRCHAAEQLVRAWSNLAPKEEGRGHSERDSGRWCRLQPVPKAPNRPLS